MPNPVTTPGADPVAGAAGPGLDLTALRALRGRNQGRDHRVLLDRVAAHLDRHDGYVSLSGGKDSVVVTDLARQVDPAVPVVWFDSGLEFPEHRTYLHQLAQAWRLNLTVIPAVPTALELLIASGAWDHDATDQPVPDLGRCLIDIPAAQARDRFGPGVVWGVRAAESRGRRRMFQVALHRQTPPGHDLYDRLPVSTGPVPTTGRSLQHGGVVRRGDGTVTYSPIWDWPDSAVWEYLAARQIPTSPVYDTLRRLGAPEHALRISTVLTATGIAHGRITWLRTGWPQLYAQLLSALPRLAEYI